MSDSAPCQAGEPFRVRNLRRDEIGLCREWADREGWNPGRHDGPCFFDADPDGFFVGELAGEPVACISCVRYDSTFGFLGQYIVKPEHRGKGLGVRVWSAGLAHLAGCNVGLDGVLDRVCYPAARETFLRGWITQPESVALAYMEEGTLRGFGCARRASEGFKIGPL